MSWLSEIAGKAESILNKIDQKTASVLNSSDIIEENQINNYETSSIDNYLANSQSLPQLRINDNNASDLYIQGHSRESSTASYHGLTMKDKTNMAKKNNFSLNNSTTKINEGNLFDYLNKKDDSLFNNLENNSKKNSKKKNLVKIENKENDKNSNEEVLENKSELIKNVLKEERKKLNDLKNEYKKQADSFSSEILFLKEKLGEHLKNKDLKNEIEKLKNQVKQEKLSKEKFENEISILSANFSKLKNDFEDYKIKAQKTLQSKEILIENLKKTNKNENSIKIEDFQKLEINYRNAIKELQEVKSNYDNIKNESNNLLNFKINELENLNSQKNIELNDLKLKYQQLDESYKKISIEHLEIKNNLNSIEQNNFLKLNEKIIEIENLNKEILNLKQNKWSQEGIPKDLELKVKNLTENLLNKQSVVENLKREKNSLALELEESKRVIKSLNKKNPDQNYCINIKDGLSEGSFNGNIFDNSPVARKFKKKIGQFDQLSNYIGFLISAYPNIKKLSLLYIIFLHFWIFFILFSWKPEV